MTAVYRAPMRARDRDVLGADWGVEHGLVGIGASTGPRLHRFAEVSDGAVVWTRLSDGTFRRGCVAGPLRDVESSVGIVHVRPAVWEPDSVEPPPPVAASFARGGRNLPADPRSRLVHCDGGGYKPLNC